MTENTRPVSGCRHLDVDSAGPPYELAAVPSSDPNPRNQRLGAPNRRPPRSVPSPMERRNPTFSEIAQLVNGYELIGSRTAFGMDNLDTFSDGTPVSTVAGPPSSRGSFAPVDVYDCGIPWLPNFIASDDYDADEATRGSAVMVVDPPDEQKSTARAARQHGDLGLRSTETHLRKARVQRDAHAVLQPAS
jgi:hypothetical protein